MKKRKVCVIISNQAFSMINFRGPLIRDLALAGIKVYALAPDYDEKCRAEIIKLGADPISYSLSRTGMNPLRDGVDMLRLIFLLHRLKPDLTLACFIKPVIFGTIAAWIARVPRRVAMIEGLGYVFEDSDAPWSIKRALLRRLVTWLYKLSLSMANLTIFLNNDDLSEFVSAGLVQKSKTFMLGGIGVDLSEWRFEPPTSRPITFLLAARLLREKGIIQFVEASRKVKELYPNVRFILLGGLDLNPGGLLKEDVDAWVREGLIEWPGHVAVKEWLRNASVFVLPSYYREGVPRSTQEAMAMGRPIITTDVPGCRDTVVENLNGFLVPPRDITALKTAMLKFIEEPSLITSMGAASRKLAEANFDVNIVNQRLRKNIGI